MSMEDDAQAIELRQWELNNRSRAEVKRYAPGEPGYGPEFCAKVDCGTDMPDARRAWGFTVCTGCQSAAEVQSRHYHRA